MRVNIGCGQSPISGWINFDNSLSVRLGKVPLIPDFLFAFKIIKEPQYQFIRFTRSQKIDYGDVVRGLPISDGAVEVLYSSHMLEHLGAKSVSLFLAEAKRIMRPGGILRISVPDIRKQVQEYINDKNADLFIEKTLLAQPPLNSFIQRFTFLFIGPRHHQWMYDGDSLSMLLKANDFVDVTIMPPGKTMIRNPDPLNLFERDEESVYVEAKRP
jgi:predicted SAM-dependent methyltransferase